MTHSARRVPALRGLAVAAAAALLASCSGGNSAAGGSDDGDEPAGGGTLVVDTAFNLETADPGRNYVPTGNMVIHAMYDTLLTFAGSDETTPVPALATMEQNEDATEFTFTLDGERTFSDGSTVDADDVVYSLTRVQGMSESKANFLMNGITVTKVDDLTVMLSTEEPALQLPAIVTNPSLSILNSEEVTDNGGTTDDSDDAQSYLDGASAGSGPYQLDSMDLNGDQASDLGEDFDVESATSAETIFLLLNQNPDVAGDLANPDFAEAVRYALDYPALLELAGTGAVEANSVIPPSFLGALDAGVEQDLDRSADALAASGYAGQTLRLQFPNDNPIGGVDFTPVAERVQAQLKDAGIDVELAPAPFASEIDPYVDGTEAMSMWFWGPDYADSSSYLPFGPGETVGLRAGWEAEASPEIADLVTAARAATDQDEREAAFSDYATAMQESGPFVPLIVTGINLASDGSVDGVMYNTTWTLDIPALQPAG